MFDPTDLRELRDGMRRFGGVFDPALLDGTGARRVVEDAAAIEKMAAAVKAAAAGRLAETGQWRREGERSPAHQLARLAGTGVGQAAQALETAKRMEQLPALAEAARAGELSPQQAAAVADAATADPQAEQRLLRKAKRGSLAELQDECRRTKAAADRDAEARRRRIHASRYLRERVDAEGAWNLSVRDNPEVGARVMGALRPIVDRLFREARAAGRREPVEAYAADALVETICGAASGPGLGPNERKPSSTAAKVLVRVDLDALLRGHPASGETCEFVGYGPVAVSAIRDLIETGDPFLVALATRGEQVVGVAHLGRRPTAAQHSALEWLYPTCRVEGCAVTARLERDHRVDWSKVKFTLLDLLDRLCEHHHDLKTLEGWALVEGTGKRPMVAPEDPRHPRHKSPPATGPPRAA